MNPPVDDATDTAQEISAASNSGVKVFHVANNRTVSFLFDVLPAMQARLHLDIIPFSKWLSLLHTIVVETMNFDDSPAATLIWMSEALDSPIWPRILLDTTETAKRSKTLRETEPVSGTLIG